MTRKELIAESCRLDREANATFLGSPRYIELRASAAECRARAAAIPLTPAPAAVSAATLSHESPLPTALVTDASREDKMRLIAASFPVAIPEEMITAAIADGRSVDEFAVAAANFVIPARAAAAEVAAADALANQILTDAGMPLRPLTGSADVEAEVARILAGAGIEQTS
jgi:hypothetical protein